MEMAPWSFQLIRYNLFWPHSRERMTATESVMSDIKKKKKQRECKRTGITEVMDVKFSLPEEEWPRCQTGIKWHQPLWTECSPEPQPVMWVVPKGCSFTHLSCLSPWDLLKRGPNRPSSGYADSDRQLSRDGFGEHTVWDEMSSPVVSCPVAV